MMIVAMAPIMMPAGTCRAYQTANYRRVRPNSLI